jgi:hypothetical protein
MKTDNKQKLEKYSYNRKRTVFFVYKLEHKIRKKKWKRTTKQKTKNTRIIEKYFFFGIFFFVPIKFVGIRISSVK